MQYIHTHKRTCAGGCPLSSFPTHSRVYAVLLVACMCGNRDAELIGDMRDKGRECSSRILRSPAGTKEERETNCWSHNCENTKVASGRAADAAYYQCVPLLLRRHPLQLPSL
eukprot:GHVU01110686.1.p2 GENE.GHVU01110686.1~~GHVU01110686.1.p2  ORF type:complete len:112 (-),score=3.28 GHVU01110686.1:460-795(-)